MMKGWTGKILRVDLLNGSYKTEDLDQEAQRLPIQDLRVKAPSMRP